MQNKYRNLLLIALLSLASFADLGAQNYYIFGASELTQTDPRYPATLKYVMRVFAWKGSGGAQTNYLARFRVDFSYDATKLENPQYFVWKDVAGPVLAYNASYSLTQGIYTITPGSDFNQSGTSQDDGSNVTHLNLDIANGNVCGSSNVAMVFDGNVTEYEIFRAYFDIKESSPPSFSSAVYYDPSVTGALLIPGPGNLDPHTPPAAIPTTSPASPPWLVYTYTGITADWDICNTTSGNPKDWSSANPGGLVFGFGAPLPVTLLDYTVTRENKAVEVKWSTAQELNNDYFVVQHSLNGKDWSNLAEVDGAGTSQVTRNYSYTHLNPAAGVNLYRVRQVAMNGSSEFSTVKAVNNNSGISGLNLYPNPATNQVNILYASQTGTKATLSITDAFGREVLRDVNFETMMTLDAKMLSNGMYFVRVTEAGQSFTQKLIIQK